MLSLLKQLLLGFSTISHRQWSTIWTTICWRTRRNLWFQGIEGWLHWSIVYPSFSFAYVYEKETKMVLKEMQQHHDSLWYQMLNLTSRFFLFSFVFVLLICLFCEGIIFVLILFSSLFYVLMDYQQIVFGRIYLMIVKLSLSVDKIKKNSTFIGYWF